ncbi:MAG: hypothetical protein ABEI39_00375 [Halobacteriales archaeon]
MDASTALRWGAVYTAGWVAATAVGLGVAVAGVAIGGLRVVGLYALTPASLRVANYPRAGFLLVLLGLAVWKAGKAAALLKTLLDAFEARTAGQFDTEAIKSDVLSVLDDRLSEMHQDVTQTRRAVDRLSREDAASDFEFPDE